jgi:hypothetical protein
MGIPPLEVGFTMSSSQLEGAAYTFWSRRARRVYFVSLGLFMVLFAIALFDSGIRLLMVMNLQLTNIPRGWAFASMWFGSVCYMTAIITVLLRLRRFYHENRNLGVANFGIIRRGAKTAALAVAIPATIAVIPSLFYQPMMGVLLVPFAILISIFLVVSNLLVLVFSRGFFSGVAMWYVVLLVLSGWLVLGLIAVAPFTGLTLQAFNQAPAQVEAYIKSMMIPLIVAYITALIFATGTNWWLFRWKWRRLGR